MVTNLLSSITSAHQSCEGSVNMQLHIGLLTYTCADTQTSGQTGTDQLIIS